MLKKMLLKKLKKIRREKIKNTIEVPSSNYPYLHLSSDDLSDVKDWDVGEDYYLVMKVTQKTKSEEEGKKTRCSFDIKEIGVVDGGQKYGLKDKYKSKLM